jgi:hypothetical protein
MKKRIILILLLAGVLAHAFSQSLSGSNYRFSANAWISFSGNSFTGSWNKDTPMSGTYSVSGTRLTLNVASGPRAGNAWAWTVVNANTLRDQDGDSWALESVSSSAEGGSKESASALAGSSSGGKSRISKGFSMAAGGGLLFDFSANNGFDMSGSFGEAYIGMRNLSFGGYGFFDGTYGEFDVSFAYGVLTAVNDIPGDSSTESLGNALQLAFTLLGKYPFAISRFTLFPLLGVSYNLVLSASDFEDDAMDVSQFGILAGAGLDFPITASLFLRGEALFQLRFAGKFWSDAADAAKEPGVSVGTTLGIGPRIKIGVGYKFF